MSGKLRKGDRTKVASGGGVQGAVGEGKADLKSLKADIDSYLRQHGPLRPRLEDGYLLFQLWGFELVLCNNGHWFTNDTSGG